MNPSPGTMTFQQDFEPDGSPRYFPSAAATWPTSCWASIW
jgi:hypothetical protein